MKVLHMSGAGNDFMVIDARGKELDFSALAKKFCAVTGADGFMAADYSDSCDFRLHFYNSDGSRGEMCGNGARCICRFAYDNGIAGESMTVQTDAGPVPGLRLAQNRYRVKLNNPTTLDFDRVPGCAYVELGCPGIPHGVVELPALEFSDKEALREQAVALRHHPKFPKGANINFFTRLDDSTVRILTFERGVEDYTLACGTGCGSVSSVLYAKGQLPGGRLTLENGGGTLTVEVGAENGAICSLLLEGPAEVLGEYELD